MKIVLFLLVCFLISVQGQLGPCIGGFCPSGYNCIGTYCYSSSSSSSSGTTCVDKTNPSTGVSDCPSRAYLCNNSIYYTLMTNQCPRTCGRCSSG